MGWFSTLRERRTLRAWAIIAVVGAVATVLLIGMQSAFASHPEASLPGSNFEIDDNANLKVDDPAPSIDWASVSESRKNDLATGANDDSYSGGTKEDDSCPGTTTGSIPNNKSDLLTFGAYVEPEVGGPGFLNLFWTRVQEPSGTTLMDFELNQSSTLCANGVNPVRTVGDLLIEYRIEQGGARAVILVRKWTGSAWGPAQDLTAQVPQRAAGTINSTPIPAAESDGLSSTQPVSARTFGEAQLDLDFVFDNTKCQSFGSAFIKSRASTSFTSQLKDFIKPVPVNITNCGKVVIRKETNPEENPNTTEFGYTKSFTTDPATPNTFTLTDDGVKTFTNVLLGTGYTVTEDVIPSGWDLESLDCSASTGVAPSISGAQVTFAIDNAADVLDCTYTNRARGEIIVEKITSDGDGPFGFTSNSLTPSSFTLTTTAAGAGGKDSRNFSDLAPGDYDVAETVPDGWDLTSATCSDNSPISKISVSAGETVTCTFTNARQKGEIVIDKVTIPGNDPQSFAFELTGGPSDLNDSFNLTDQATPHKSGAVLIGSGYSAAETVPDGWDLTSATCDDGSPVTNINVGANETVTCTFENTKRGHIVIDKVTNPPNDPQSFAFKLTGGPSDLNDSFNLTDQATPHDSGAIKPGNGYSAAETVPDGWDLTSATCDDNSPVTNINVSPGETVTCTFNNAKKTTTISTEQSFTPQDTATIGSTGNGTLNGKVDFKLYKGPDCDPTNSELVYSEDNVSLDGDNKAKTNNTTYTISDEGTREYHWEVSYHDDTNGFPNASSCVEESTVTIDNDNTP